jgi:hypothetical protein
MLMNANPASAAATTGPSCFPWIVESALKNRQKQFVVDG